MFFVIGRQSRADHDENVNARYIVEHADITGIPDHELTEGLRDDLQSSSTSVSTRETRIVCRTAWTRASALRD